jgi:hypothetical protein
MAVLIVCYAHSGNAGKGAARIREKAGRTPFLLESGTALPGGLKGAVLYGAPAHGLLAGAAVVHEG